MSVCVGVCVSPVNVIDGVGVGVTSNVEPDISLVNPYSVDPVTLNVIPVNELSCVKSL